MRAAKKAFIRSAKRRAQLAPISEASPSVNDIQWANSIKFQPKNVRQQLHTQSIVKNQLTLALGPSGTGKTHVSIAALAEGILRGRYDRGVLMRPAIALDDEEHGYLPGHLHEKVAPWARPMFRKLAKLIGMNRVQTMLKDGRLEVCPFTYLRGDEFESRTFVMLDEAQNCSIAQLRAFTTRIADGATIVIAGDVEQHDRTSVSGLEVLHWIIDSSLAIDCGIIEYQVSDIVRGSLCQSFVDAWAQYDRTQRRGLTVAAE